MQRPSTNSAGRLAAITLAAIAVTFASTPLAAAPAQLATNLQPLAPYMGQWRCEGTIFASPAGPAHAFAATYDIASDLAGQWIAARYTEAVSDVHPVAFDHLELWGYDRRSDRLVNVFVNSAGDAGRLTAAGVADGQVVWQGESPLGGNLVPFRGIIERRSDAMVLTPTLQTPDGTWVPIAELVCER